jgi:hypothetical protein
VTHRPARPQGTPQTPRWGSPVVENRCSVDRPGQRIVPVLAQSPNLAAETSGCTHEGHGAPSPASHTSTRRTGV